MFTWIKKILGPKLTNKIRPFGHGLKSYFKAASLNFPSKKLTIIGITGTKGKTSTSIYLGRLMNLAGLPTGYITTASICLNPYNQELENLEQKSKLEKQKYLKIESEKEQILQRLENGTQFQQIYNRYEVLNQLKMTTLDGAQLQESLQTMIKNGCQYAVLEMSSQGLEQNRHWGITGFDLTLFLNIYPEHIEAHGSWDLYRRAKAILFKNLKKNGTFLANGNPDMLENTEYMWSFVKNKDSVKKILLVKDKDWQSLDGNNLFKQLILKKPGDKNLEPKVIDTYCIADFEIDNLFFAYSALKVFKPEFTLTKKDLVKKFNFNLPGRMQWVVIDNQII